MLEQKIKEIEDFIDKKKENIRKDTNRQEKKLDFVKHIFYENYKIMAEYVKKENISIEDAFSHLVTIINGLSTPLYIEHNDGKTFTLKEVDEMLHVKLGYYEIFNSSQANPEEPFEQCSLEITEKGQKVYSKYKQLEKF